MPHTPEGTGFRNTDTSAMAALEIDAVGRAANLRTKVYAVLKASTKPLSTDDLCKILGEDPASLQPRTSELRHAGKIEDSGVRGTSRLGRSCIMWRAVTPAAPETTNNQ